jgi:hypothetical protein
MRQVNTKGIKLANKCMIMAAVAYNLKKLVNGISTKIRKRTFKTFREAKRQPINPYLPSILQLNMIILYFFIYSKKQMAE